jgi:hypothetical protein
MLKPGKKPGLNVVNAIPEKHLFIGHMMHTEGFQNTSMKHQRPPYMAPAQNPATGGPFSGILGL